VEPWIVGLWTAGGALAYNVWGFIRAYNETKKTALEERFEWTRSIVTVAPVLVVGFLAGYQLTPSTVTDIVGLVLAGFGAASAATKLGIESFFRVK
jgi:hypothetical protein